MRQRHTSARVWVEGKPQNTVVLFQTLPIYTPPTHSAGYSPFLPADNQLSNEICPVSLRIVEAKKET